MAAKNVMISYRTTEPDPALEIFDLLKKGGFSPWLDREGISPGEPWRNQLLDQVRTCDAMVAMVSRDYLTSQHCRMEIFVARSRGCPVLPIMLQDCFDLFDEYEETRGLADLFAARFEALRLVGRPATREELMQRVVDSLRTVGAPSPPKETYVSYASDRASQAESIVDHLEASGISAWIATRDCRIGENWRQAQANALMQARCHILVIDSDVARGNVLRTELLLGEAFGVPILPVLSRDLATAPREVAGLMEALRTGDLTYARIAAQQPFGPDDLDGIRTAVARHVRQTGHWAPLRWLLGR